VYPSYHPYLVTKIMLPGYLFRPKDLRSTGNVPKCNRFGFVSGPRAPCLDYDTFNGWGCLDRRRFCLLSLWWRLLCDCNM